MTQLRDHSFTMDGMAQLRRHDLGDGEPCQAAGCIRRDTAWHKPRELWLCPFCTERFS